MSKATAIARWGGCIKRYLYDGTVPGSVGAATLREVERELGCEPGYLARFARMEQKAQKVADFSAHRDAYRESLPHLLARPYFASFDRDPEMAAVKEGWERFFRYQRAPDPVIKRSKRWTRNARGEYGSANRYQIELESFFGWLTLPPGDDPGHSGLGLKKEVLTFALAGHWDLWRRFIEFRHERSGGGDSYSTEVAFQLGVFTKLTRPRYGWLNQTEAEWLDALAPALRAAGCEEVPGRGFFDAQYGAKGEWRERVQPIFEKRRVPEDTLDCFLSVKSPMSEFIYPLIARLEKEVPPASAGARAVYDAERRLIVVVAFFSVPMRLQNWETAELGRHVIKQDGRYHLRVRTGEVKNRERMRREMRRAGYVVTVPGWAQRYFRHWVEDVLPTAPNGAPTRLLSGWNGKAPTEAGLRAIFNHVFRKHFGFAVSPHASRHIVATNFLKADPGNPYVVAAFLADTVDEVLKHYAHLIDQDFFLHFDRFSSEQAEAVLRRHGIVIEP